MKTIDINCDIGEGLENEHLVLPLITSCNIACGGHAGSIKIIDKILFLAKQYNVKIGAHPSFPDKENFGRKVMQISNSALYESLVNQLHLFNQRAHIQKVKIHHIKAHGALCNLISVDFDKAECFVQAVLHVFKKVNLYVPFNSVIEKVAIINKLPIIYEAFADRNYNEDLTLVDRTEPNAILIEPKEIVKHVLNIKQGIVKTITGNEVLIKADTFCVHGDNENVVEILKSLNHHFS